MRSRPMRESLQGQLASAHHTYLHDLGFDLPNDVRSPPAAHPLYLGAVLSRCPHYSSSMRVRCSQLSAGRTMWLKPVVSF